MDSSGKGGDQDEVIRLLDQQRRVIEQQEQLIQQQKKYIESQFDILQQHHQQLEHKQCHQPDYQIKYQQLHSSINQDSRIQQKQQKNDSEEPTQSYQVKYVENVEPFHIPFVDKVSKTLPIGNNVELVHTYKSPFVDRVSETLPNDRNVELVHICNSPDRVIETLHTDKNVEIGPIHNKDRLDNIQFLQHYSPQSLNCNEVDSIISTAKCSSKKTSSTITNISSKKRRLDEGSLDIMFDDITPSIFDVGVFQAADYELSVDKDDKQTKEVKDLAIVPVNKSNSKGRTVLKIVKNIKDPYLNFGVEEEFLVAQLHEVKQQIGNEATAYYLENNLDSYLKDLDNFLEIVENKVFTWKDYLKGYEERKFLTLKIVSKLGNSLIPRKFGKFPDRFLVNVLEHSFDSCAQIEHALFATLDEDYVDLYTQNMKSNIEWSCANKEFMEKNLSCLKNYPAVKFEELGVFKSPWCSSYEEEQFFMETTKELGLELRRYPRLVGIATMMSMVIQPESSPFSKSKNLQRFFKELASLMNRYLVAVNENAFEASKDCERIISLIMKLPRCSDIFLNKRLK